MKPFAPIACLACLLLLLLAACQPSPTPLAPGETPWPDPDWLVSTPAEQGLDPQMLDAMDTYLEDSGKELHSLLIIRHGQIVYERYWPGYDRNTDHTQYSVTKSFISTLVGIAIDQGKLAGVDVPVKDLLPGRSFAAADERKDAMVLEDLLTMRSGLDWSENDATYQAMYVSGDMLGWTMDLPMQSQPGKQFAYCSGCSHVLSAVVNEAVEQDGLEFARENLLEPIGIRRFHWKSAPEGYLIGGWGLQLAPRDMARLGYLFLQHGKWRDRQVVSEEWVRAATTRHTGTGGNLGYGYQWWIYPRYHAYAALGRDGQTIFVLPDHDMVVVTTARIDGHDPVFHLIDAYVVPAAEK